MAGGLFRLEDVYASRGGHPVLEGLDLTIDEGATAVLGPSGAGKSTLLRLLNRLADPDSGCVRFRGKDVRGLDPLGLRRRACLVPQLPALLPGTVEDNVRYGPSLCGRPTDVRRCLRLAGLDDGYAGRQADRLSVGEQQRVMLARALALEPEVLLLDEPTEGLMPSMIAKIRETVVELRRRGVSTILVEQRVDAVLSVADRAAFLENGRNRETLDIEALRADPGIVKRYVGVG
jgi:branched-chain amino acid transport system ATP-binding protein